jgi:hypothetical protein
LKILSANEDFRIQYRGYVRSENDRISRETNARAGGLAEGEAKKARETAALMLAEGLHADVVSRCTGLLIEEIYALNKA